MQDGANKVFTDSRGGLTTIGALSCVWVSRSGAVGHPETRSTRPPAVVSSNPPPPAFKMASVRAACAASPDHQPTLVTWLYR